MRHLDVRTFVVVSTAHLTAMTALILDGTSASEWSCAGGPYADYGWFVYAHDENGGVGPDRIPNDLFGVMTWGESKAFITFSSIVMAIWSTTCRVTIGNAARLAVWETCTARRPVILRRSRSGDPSGEGANGRK